MMPQDQNNNGIEDKLENFVYATMAIAPFVMMFLGLIAIAFSEHYKLQFTRDAAYGIVTGGLAMLGTAKRK